ncbi:glycosyltransferase family 1 protein [Pseudomonas sp. G11-1]|uniref:Glycosyltransferase family 4 protein n=1 Tax=Halopseudomonas bauzanensis TaxID=653930 RepID=A0A4V5NMN3_9GAMM|nr:glycosyltransferase family 1 protein [Halopseudomonas bauzanensis]MCO5786558.1 glycosyltransferase family 1 protein [Pseudomonas sp. G11-1]MCO5789784.1 glycosyltransferase family 1 protein [Pseudomonas sp. G11-2]TKA92297.1 glycosyltransferase family 4 protein [Halopseudomonas bauzanensis]
MRVALDVSILHAPRTGIGEYALQLGRALQKSPELELALFDGLRWRDDFPAAPQPGYGKLSQAVKAILPNAYRVRRQLMQRRFDSGAKRLRPQVYHQPSLWPLRFDGPTVMTLHDLTHVHYPETQPSDRLRAIEHYLPTALQQASRILVDSQFIADEVTLHYGVPRSKLQIAPLGVAPRFHPRSEEQLRIRLAAHQLQMHSYYLCLGTLEPRKNLDLAIAAYLTLPDRIRHRMPLLIIGARGWRQEQLTKIPHRAQAHGQIRLLGYEDENCVAELLAGAHALLFPSRYEGFGLPVLEAMASGTPVIASDCGAIPEVAEKAALYMDPDDIDGCRSQMLALLNDDSLQATLREQGQQRARQFSWERCAQITVDTYRTAGHF